MSRLVRASKLIGMPLITIDTADVVGEVRDVLTDPQAATIAAFTVRGRRLLSPALIGVLPMDRVQAIGRDALIITAADALLDADEPALQPIDQPELIGRQVVTGNGDEVGTVTDLVVEVEGTSTAVVGYEIERADGQRLLTPLYGRPVLEHNPLVISDGATPATYGLAGLRRMLDAPGPSRIAPV